MNASLPTSTASLRAKTALCSLNTSMKSSKILKWKAGVRICKNNPISSHCLTSALCLAVAHLSARMPLAVGASEQPCAQPGMQVVVVVALVYELLAVQYGLQCKDGDRVSNEGSTPNPRLKLTSTVSGSKSSTRGDVPCQTRLMPMRVPQSFCIPITRLKSSVNAENRPN